MPELSDLPDPPGLPVALAEIAARAESLATPVARASTLHGPKHWRDVARVAHLIRLETPTADPRSLFLFAAIHDTQRLNDGYDPEHGARAADVLSEIDHGLDAARLATLAHALRHHTGAGTHDDPTIGACWDADRLTLDRVGITPELRYLSTPAVRSDLARLGGIARDIVFGPDCEWDVIEVGFAAATEPGRR